MRLSAVLALALLCGPSCSLVFSNSKDDTGDAGFTDAGVLDAGPDAMQQCLGQARTYSRGAPITRTPAGRYKHIDYQQGTLTFWFRALEPIATNTVLVNLQGIKVLAAPTGLIVEIETDADDQIHEFAEDLSWEVGTDHFVTLRWDAGKALSGGGGNRHVSVGVDDQQESFKGGTAYSPVAGSQTEFQIGDASGGFHVDQLLIYDRALFVDNDATVLSDMRVMGAAKGDSAELVRGGFEVLFATIAPAIAGCDNYTAEAWAFPEDKLASDVQLGDRSLWGGNPTSITAPGPVYPNGGFALLNAQEATESFSNVASSSYSLAVILHDTSIGSQAQLIVNSTEAPLLSSNSAIGSLDDPALSLQSVQTPSDVHDIEIEVVAFGGIVAFDSIRLWLNLLKAPGFEETGELSSWVSSGEGVTFKPLAAEVYAGSQSACLSLSESASIAQDVELGGTTDSLYLVGAKSRWKSAEAPTLTMSDSSLLATGVPASFRQTAIATALRADSTWGVMGTVARRPGDAPDDGSNVIRFGVEVGATNFCLDSTYLIKLDHIIGTVL